jgi:hypothetical protein
MIGFRKVRKPTFRTVKSGLVSARLRNHFIRPKPMSLGQLKMHCKARIDLYLPTIPNSLYFTALAVVESSRTKAALKRRLQLELPAAFPDSAFIGF